MDWKQSTHAIAEQLLGSKLCRQIGAKTIRATIYEVEIYDGHDDKASHASRGETARTKIMFGPAGFWYVYLIYGMYCMLNLVTREAGYPAAILIRGVLLEDGTKLNGPGKITKWLNIDKKLNEKKASKSSGLWIEWRKGELSAGVDSIERTARIGIDYAGDTWKNEPLRYLYNPSN